QGMAQHVKRTEKIDLDVARPIAWVGVENSRGGLQHTGIVDDNADPGELRRRLVDRIPHHRPVRDITRNGEPADFPGQALGRPGAPREKSDLVALTSEKPRRRLTDAPACAGDQEWCWTLSHRIPPVDAVDKMATGSSACTHLVGEMIFVVPAQAG